MHLKMQIKINIDQEHVIELVKHLSLAHTVDYKIYIAVKNMIDQILTCNKLNSEQEEQIKTFSEDFEKVQRKIFVWGNR
ncbi:MAG: hypothetical protein HWN66_18190 [Candidatus Helarchaeota archaeon]|nr:hypothetical protein [Candidatus Helarchaeota archaeon]